MHPHYVGAFFLIRLPMFLGFVTYVLGYELSSNLNGPYRTDLNEQARMVRIRAV